MSNPSRLVHSGEEKPKVPESREISGHLLALVRVAEKVAVGGWEIDAHFSLDMYGSVSGIFKIQEDFNKENVAPVGYVGASATGRGLSAKKGLGLTQQPLTEWSTNSTSTQSANLDVRKNSHSAL